MDNNASSAPKPSTKDDERVLVAPTALFRSLGEFQGFLTEDVDRYAPLFDASNTRFMRRGDAELDKAYKQLIPYAIFVSRVDGETQVFAYRRGKGQGEARLRSKWSAGVGGHVNDSDLSGDEPDAFEAGTKREIAEEVVLDSPVLSFKKVGLVNDDRTEVGCVHLGVVCLVELAEPKMRSNETDLIEARFRPVDELLDEIEESPEKFESWTALALQNLYGRDREQTRS